MLRQKPASINHLDEATRLNQWALSYKAKGRYTEAEPLFKQSLAICEKKHGSNHPDVAIGFFNLAGLYSKQNDHAQAEKLYQRALLIWERVSKLAIATFSSDPLRFTPDIEELTQWND